MSARLYNIDGSVEDIGHAPTLEEAQALIGGTVQMLPLFVGRTVEQLLFNEDGTRLKLEYNESASQLAGRQIVGPAIRLSKKEKIK